MKIYITFSPEEESLIIENSTKIGLTPSAFVKYRALLGLSNNDQLSLEELTKLMFAALNKKCSNEPFIVSSLLPEHWVKLNRSTKMCLSKALSKYIKSDKSGFKIVGKLKDKTNIYCRI